MAMPRCTLPDRIERQPMTCCINLASRQWQQYIFQTGRKAVLDPQRHCLLPVSKVGSWVQTSYHTQQGFVTKSIGIRWHEGCVPAACPEEILCIPSQIQQKKPDLIFFCLIVLHQLET